MYKLWFQSVNFAFFFIQMFLPIIHIPAEHWDDNNVLLADFSRSRKSQRRTANYCFFCSLTLTIRWIGYPTRPGRHQEHALLALRGTAVKTPTSKILYVTACRDEGTHTSVSARRSPDVSAWYIYRFNGFQKTVCDDTSWVSTPII